MKTALQHYIEDLKSGTCKGEEYYLELEKKHIVEAYNNGQQIPTFVYGEKYYRLIFKNEQK